MTAKIPNALQLTAKQRLAVSRQALVLASGQPVWRGLSTWATQELLSLLKRRLTGEQSSTMKK
jgi:hypothetical protein